MRKKVLALVLAFVMVVAMLPTVAFAEEGPPPTTAADLAKAIAPGQGTEGYDTQKVSVSGNTVTLKSDIESVTTDIHIFGGNSSELTVDLNQHTLNLGGTTDYNNEIVLFQGAKLTIKGNSGTVATNGKYATIAVYGGSSLTVEKGVTIKNECAAPEELKPGEEAVGAAIAAAISGNYPGGGKITINGATVTGLRGISVDAVGSTLTVQEYSNITGTTYNGIMIQGNAEVTVNGGAIKGGPTGVYVGGYDPKNQTTSPGHLTVNGGTIKGTGDNDDGVGVFAYHDSTAIISNGEVKGHTGVRAWDGAEVEIKGSAKITGTESGVDVYGYPEENAGNNGAAEVTISGGTVNGRYGAFAYGGGQLTVSGGEVTGQTAGIGTNGSDVSEETQVTVTGGTVKGETAGVYLPAGKMTVDDNAKIEGKAGIVVRGGDLSVEGGTITATGTGYVTIGDATQGGVRYTVPAAGITVDIGAEYPAQEGGQKHVTITEGATVTATQTGGKTVAATNKGEEVTAGDSGKVDAEENPFDIQGGTLMVDDKPDKDNVTQFLNKGYEYDQNGEITEDTDTTATFKAEIVDGLKYETLEEALTHVVAGNTIKLLNDVTLPGSMDNATAKDRIEITNEITLDLGGMTISKSADLAEDKAGMLIGANGKLTIKGTGTITGKGTLLLANANGELTIEDGVTITQEKGADDNNDTAVATNGGRLTINGGTITAAESGVGVFGTGTLTVNGGTIDAQSHGISTNGAQTWDEAKIKINAGTIKATNGAGVYLPKGGLEMSDGSVSGAAGIVVRGGKATVTGGTVEATSTEETVGIGDANPATVVPAAVVVDKNGDSYGDGSATLNGGEFKATEGKPAVVYSEDGANKSTDANANKKLTVKGGYYSSSLKDTQLLDPSLNTEANIGNGTEYGYFTSVVEAEQQLAEDNKTAEISVIEGKAAIVAAGFLTEADNDYLNGLAETAKGAGKTWGADGIKDCVDNTFYAAFSAKEEPGAEYEVEFAKGEQKYTETVPGVTEGGIVYFTPGYQNEKGNIPATDFQGEYTVTLTKGEDATALSTATIEIYQVNYINGDNVVGGPEIKTIYVDKAGLDDVEKATPESLGYKMTGTANTWNDIKYVPHSSQDKYTYDVTVSAKYVASSSSSGGGGHRGSSSAAASSASVTSEKTTNGSFTVSDKNAAAGTTVKVTPKANKGYVVDEVTVTDDNGRSVKVKDNGDGTYSFVMPEKAAQPVSVEVTFKPEVVEKDTPSDKFADVAANAWYSEAVDYVVANGLMNGIDDETFAPNATTTRGMVVTILYRLEGEPGVTRNLPFADVAAGKWYSDAINWASTNGIVTGYDENTFGPDDSVTRAQMAAILYRYAELKGYNVSRLADLAGYADAAAIGSWADAAMRWAVAEGLIEGTASDTLSPNGNSTRAQIATILMRFCESVAK